MGLINKVFGGHRAVIRPLNLSASDYARIYHEQPPGHLGIGLVAMFDENVELAAKLMLIARINAAKQTLTALCEYDGFRNEFLPPTVQQISVQVCFVETDPGFWHELSKIQALWCHTGLTIQVALFDGNRALTDQQLTDLSLAIAHLDDWIVKTGSTDPSAHKPVVVDPKFAALYAKNIGNLYKSGIGIWPEGLVGFRNVLMTGMKACLEEDSIIGRMREFIACKRSYYWE